MDALSLVKMNIKVLIKNFIFVSLFVLNKVVYQLMLQSFKIKKP